MAIDQELHDIMRRLAEKVNYNGDKMEVVANLGAREGTPQDDDPRLDPNKPTGCCLAVVAIPTYDPERNEWYAVPKFLTAGSLRNMFECLQMLSGHLMNIARPNPSAPSPGEEDILKQLKERNDESSSPPAP